MQVENHSEDISSQPKFDVDVTEKRQVANEHENGSRRAVTPAKLPPHSQAAVAQRLYDVPERPIAGFMYSASHLRVHPADWYTKRHAKRKKLRLNLMHAAIMEHKSTLTLRNMAIGLFTLMVVSSIALAAFVSFIGATQQRFGNQVLRLERVPPGDRLRLYGMHGPQIYETTAPGLHIKVPLFTTSR